MILLAVRDPISAKKSVESSIDDTLTQEKIIYEKCDVSDVESVKEFAKRVQEQFPAIHLLINNGEISSAEPS